MNGTVNYSVEGAKYGISFGHRARHRDLLHQQSFRIVGVSPHGFFDERALTTTLGTSAFEQ